MSKGGCEEIAQPACAPEHPVAGPSIEIATICGIRVFVFSRRDQVGQEDQVQHVVRLLGLHDKQQANDV